MEFCLWDSIYSVQAQESSNGIWGWSAQCNIINELFIDTEEYYMVYKYY